MWLKPNGYEGLIQVSARPWERGSVPNIELRAIRDAALLTIYLERLPFKRSQAWELALDGSQADDAP